MPAQTWCLRGSGQSRSEHDRICAGGDGSDNISALAEAPIGDDVNVAPAGLIQVIAPRTGHIRNRARHGCVDTQRCPGAGGGTSTKADKHTGGTGAHQVQCRRIGGSAPDDDGNIKLVDELLKIQRLPVLADVFRAHGSATNNEQVNTGFHHRLVKLTSALGTK